MREVLPGVYHWTAIHPRIGVEVSSYWLDDAGVLIDPLTPPEVGIEWFADRPNPPRRSCSPTAITTGTAASSPRAMGAPCCA